MTRAETVEKLELALSEAAAELHVAVAGRKPDEAARWAEVCSYAAEALVALDGEE